MRLRNVKNAQEILNESSYVIKTPKEHKKTFQKIFENENSIHLEIGMGERTVYY